MSEQAEYYSDWKERTFGCKCGWSGTPASMTHELFRELIELSCPDCDEHVSLVSLPTRADLEKAAARGNAEAIAEMKRLADKA